MNAADLSGCYDLSNSIAVVRTPADTTVDGGTLEGGPFEFCGDGMSDMVENITLTGNIGSKSAYILATSEGLIIGATSSLERIEQINFDRVFPGTYLLYHISYENVNGVRRGNNLSELTGEFDLSNAISITKKAVKAGRLYGGPYKFTIDGRPDFVKRIYAAYGLGENSSYVITDTEGNILGVPPTLEAVKAVNFDDAGPGVCLIWNIRYEGELQGLEVGKNANDLSGGCYDFSNPLKVIRSAGRELNKNPNFSVDSTEFDVVIYPQPASSIMNVSVNVSNNESLSMVKVYDMAGHLVHQEELKNKNAMSMNVSGMSPGVYILDVKDQNSGKSMQKQIIIEK